MEIWQALQYVGTGLSLVAFVVAAILLAYRARLTNRAEIINSAPEKERLQAIAATAEFFRVDVSGLSRPQQQDIVLKQIDARARRDLLLAVVTLIVAVLLAIIATVAILTSKPAGPATAVHDGKGGTNCAENASIATQGDVSHVTINAAGATLQASGTLDCGNSATRKP
jgi:hypothetical protein